MKISLSKIHFMKNLTPQRCVNGKHMAIWMMYEYMLNEWFDVWCIFVVLKIVLILDNCFAICYKNMCVVNTLCVLHVSKMLGSFIWKSQQAILTPPVCCYCVLQCQRVDALRRCYCCYTCMFSCLHGRC